MAKHARRLLNLVDDTPIVPGDTHPAFDGMEAARQVLNDAEADLRDYELHVEPIHSNAGNLGVGAMPGVSTTSPTSTTHQQAPTLGEEKFETGDLQSSLPHVSDGTEHAGKDTLAQKEIAA